ncbi:MAG: Rrf2 family transcriptional regulator [Candidatus Omnitrophica bacterium]|nr:Rrf2 family transcriptional regulator [Candidatus Omnitrophota bacterium]
MKLTTKSEYSLLALVYIARSGNNDYVKIEDICKKYDISKKYLEHLFLSLKQAKYLKAKRGSNGGYKLAVSPQKISVAEIIRLMDGALAPTLVVSKYFFEHTPIEKEKKIMSVFKEIRDYISNKVERLKIADLI